MLLKTWSLRLNGDDYPHVTEAVINTDEIVFAQIGSLGGQQTTHVGFRTGASGHFYASLLEKLLKHAT